MHSALGLASRVDGIARGRNGLCSQPLRLLWRIRIRSFRTVVSAPSAQAEHQVQRALLLNVVVAEGAAVLELLPSEDQALLIGRNALLVLNLLLHVVDRVAGLHVERDGLARESLDEYLHRCCLSL